MMLPRIMFAYLALFQVALLVASFFINQDAAPHALSVTPQVAGLLIMAVVSFLLGFVLPGRMKGFAKAPGAGKSHPLSDVITPFMIRVCLFEMCSVFGFVAAYLHHDWRYMVPFAVMGLAGTALSAPTDALFAKLRNG